MSENYVYDLALADPELEQVIRDEIQYQFDHGILKDQGYTWDFWVTSDLKWETDDRGLTVASASTSGTPAYVFDRV